MTTYWLRNTQGCVLDISVLRDASKQPLVWHAAGAPHSRRCLERETLGRDIIRHLLLTCQVVPDPQYDAEASHRDLSAVLDIYDQVFGSSTPAAAPAVEPPAVKAFEELVKAPEPGAPEPGAPEPEAPEPEVTEPEVTEPEAPEPEAPEPEVTEPEVTEPEAPEPEVTEPEAPEPEVTEPEVTEPEVTEPEVTEPEVTEPEPARVSAPGGKTQTRRRR